MKEQSEIKRKLARLIDVKSILTLLLTIVVCFLAIFKGFDIKDIYLMIIAFYFGTQSVKKSNEEEK